MDKNNVKITIRNFQLHTIDPLECNDQLRRSFVINNTVTNLNLLGDLLTNKISEINLAKHMSELMTLAVDDCSAVDISYGWGSPRLAFTFDAESSLSGLNYVTRIQGYTGVVDPNNFSVIEDNLTFTINSITSYVKLKDPITGNPIFRVHNNSNVITNELDEVGGVELKLIRPSDIMNNIANVITFGNMSDMNITNITDNYNARNTTLSDRNNNNPLSYLNRIINSYSNAKLFGDPCHDAGDIVSMSGHDMSPANMLAIPFIGNLHSLTGIINPTSFNMKTLLAVDNDFKPEDIILNVNPVTEPVAKPDTTTVEYLVALNVSNIVTGLITNNMLSAMSFSSNNLDDYVHTIPDSKSVMCDDIDIAKSVDRVMAYVDNVLMPLITLNNTRLVSLNVDCNSVGITTVSIVINNGVLKEFKFPTFADSLYSPIISDLERSIGMTDEVGSILDVIASVDIIK